MQKTLYYLNLSNRYAKNPTHPVWYFAATITGNRRALHFPLFYTYLKWIDDRIDLDLNQKEPATEFLNRQFEILNGKRSPEKDIEFLGFYLGNHSRNSTGSGYLDSLDRFRRGFQIDIERRGRWNSSFEIEERNRTFGIAMLDLAESCFGTSGELEPIFKETLGRIYMFSDMVLDLFEDFDTGYRNIPLEWIPVSSQVSIESKSILGNPSIQKRFTDEIHEYNNLIPLVLTDIQEVSSPLLRWFLKSMIKKRANKLERALQ